MTTSKHVTINSRSYDGTIRRSWKCDLVRRQGTLLEFVGVFDRTVQHADLGTIEQGTVSYEYYWLDRWYNIFRFERPKGDLRNYYCNINMPPVFENDVLDYVDLDLDVLVWPGGQIKVLDREEFDANSIVFGYPAEIVQQAEAALDEVLDLIRRDKLPA